MADAPSPITSPPALDFQPYDAAAEGTLDTAPGPERTYDANPGRGWEKLRDGGAASWTDGSAGGGWPGDGTSDGSMWRQT